MNLTPSSAFGTGFRRRLLAGALACATAASLPLAGVAQAPSPKHTATAAKSEPAKPAPTTAKADAAKSVTASPKSEPARPQPVNVTLTAEQRAVLFRALDGAEQDGFAKSEFAPDELGTLLASKDKEELARGQELLVSGVIRYAKAQHGLRSFHGEDWPKEWALRPQPYDAEKDFLFAVQQNKLPDWLNTLPPPFARYRALKAALSGVRAQADAPPQASPRHTKRGKGKAAKLARVKAPAAATGDGASQASGAVTLSREAQINSLIANMERWRWMPRNTSPDRVEANTAAGLLQVWQGGKPTLAMKAAAGKPGDETPMLTSAIDSIVFNPAWHVPKSIADDEIYPKGKRDKGYFKREGFIQSKDSDSGLLQKPGPKNALGQIKFDFKNPFAVYLHDTPAQAAFERSARNVSHGCVRVEKPVDLASLLLQGAPEGNPDAINQIVAAADTKRVEVGKPMPVFLLYWTAFAGDAGKVEFRKDVYDWDAKLLQLLAAGRASA